MAFPCSGSGPGGHPPNTSSELWGECRQGTHTAAGKSIHRNRIKTRTLLKDDRKEAQTIERGKRLEVEVVAMVVFCEWLMLLYQAKHSAGTETTWGIDGITGQIADMKDLGIWEPYAVKVQTIKTAVEVSQNSHGLMGGGGKVCYRYVSY